MATSDKGLVGIPLRAKLSAKYKNSFAYPTIKDRCPVILCKIIDHLYRERLSIGKVYGMEAQEGLKKIIDLLSGLRYEMQTNKEIKPLSDGRKCCQIWNDYLNDEKNKGEGTTWFSASWMWAECYLYRNNQT